VLRKQELEVLQQLEPEVLQMVAEVVEVEVVQLFVLEQEAEAVEELSLLQVLVDQMVHHHRPRVGSLQTLLRLLLLQL
jgi:hypothetical protein